MRWALLVANCAAIALAMLWRMPSWSAASTPTPVLVAQRDLPANSRVEPKDVAAPAVVGRYTRGFVQRGGTIAAAALSPRPQLGLETGAMLVVLPLGPASLEANAGSQVHLCRRAEAVSGLLTVRTKLCVSDLRCDVVVSVPSAEIARLAAAKDALGAELRLAGKGCAA